jgi:hypothetical protein
MYAFMRVVKKNKSEKEVFSGMHFPYIIFARFNILQSVFSAS